MAIQTVPNFSPFLAAWFGPTPGVIALSTTGQKYGQIMRAPKSGVVDKITYYVASASNNQPVKVSLQTRGTDGMPSGTLHGGSAAQVVTPTIGTWNTATLTTPATVTAGDWFGPVIEFDNTTGNISFQQTNPATFMEAATYSGTAWTRQTSGVLMVPIYSDGSYPETGALVARNVSTNYTLSSSPDEVGIIFKCPIAMRICGAQTSATLASAGVQADLVLYDDTGAEVLVLRQYGTNSTMLFASKATLDPTRYYRLTWRPVSGTVVQIRAVFPELAAKTPFAALFDMSMTTRTDLGAWTQTPLELPFLMPMFDGVEVGSGGGNIFVIED